MNIRQALYGALLDMQRRTVRRDYRRELDFQRRFRARDVAAQEHECRTQAVAYVNRMAGAIPVYRERLEAAGISLPLGNRDEDWQRLPLLRKADFQQDVDRWVNPLYTEAQRRWGYTSGSSGEPFRFTEDDASRMAEFLSFELSLRSTGWRPGEREAIIKVNVPPITGMRRLARRMLGNIPVTFSAVGFKLEDTPAIAEALNRHRIQFLRSYPTVLLLLAGEMLRLGLRCHVPRIVVFGEGLSASRARVIEEAFGARVFRDYGGSEAMHVGFECAHCGEYHLDLSRFRVEVLDGSRPCACGEPGEIVVTAYRNNTMPFVRYRMGDIGLLSTPSDPARCGCASARLARIEGRVIDVIRAANGKILDAAFLVVVMEYAHEHILAYKFVQTDEAMVDAYYVPRHALAHTHLRGLEEQILDRTGGAIRVTWRPVTAIPAEASGKRKILVPLKNDWKTSVDQEPEMILSR